MNIPAGAFGLAGWSLGNWVTFTFVAHPPASSATKHAIGRRKSFILRSLLKTPKALSIEPTFQGWGEASPTSRASTRLARMLRPNFDPKP